MNTSHSAVKRFASGLLHRKAATTMFAPLTAVACALIVLMLGIDAGHSAAEMTTVWILTIDPSSPTTLYAGTPDAGVFKSTDGGRNWAPSGLTSGAITAMALDPLSPTTVYAARYGDGVWKSSDGGTTWTSVGLTNATIYSLTIDSVPVTTLYAGTGSGVLKSVDGGATWISVGPTNAAIYSLVVDPMGSTILYAGSAGAEPPTGVRLFKSTDGGVSWSLTSLTSMAWQAYSTNLVIDPLIPATLYTAYSGWGCDADGCFTLAVISKSIDGGANWFDIDALAYWGSWVSPQPWINAIAIDPVTPTTLYAAWSVQCGQFDPGCQPWNWVSKSTDGGSSWSSTADFFAYSFAIDPRTPTTLYAATGAGVLRSVDGGSTWSVPDVPPPPADTTPPDTSTTSASDGSGTALNNDAVTLSTSLTLSFTGTDNVGLSRFECQLDGAGFNVCTSPLTHNALTLGRHTFEVRAVDRSGNVDATPARYTWTVDAAPETTINGAVDGRGKSLTNGGRTTSDKVTFRFAGTDNGTVARFECGFDAGTFSSCTSSVTYGAVSRGTHTFRVRAVDNNGLADPSPAVFNWTR